MVVHPAIKVFTAPRAIIPSISVVVGPSRGAASFTVSTPIDSLRRTSVASVGMGAGGLLG
jgi:hypothetical protein